MIEAVFGVILEAAAKGAEEALSGFGRFKVTARAARQGRNLRHRRDDRDSRLAQARVQRQGRRDQVNEPKAGAGEDKARQGAGAAVGVWSTSPNAVGVQARCGLFSTRESS